jgi:hypothetical protein
MQKLEVGKPYQEGLNRIPEGMVFDFNQAGGFLRVVFDRPLDPELKEIKQGSIKLGLLEKEGIIFFFIKFGRLDWMDSPYNVALSKHYDLEELTENTGYAVQIVLIDGMTGLVHALKLIELPHAMSVRLKELVEKQRKTQIRDYDNVLKRIYSSYMTEDLSKSADKYLL